MATKFEQEITLEGPWPTLSDVYNARSLPAIHHHTILFLMYYTIELKFSL